MKKAVLVLCLILSACTSSADIQRHCAAVSQSFVQEVACFEAQAAQDPYLSNDSFVQEYMLSGRVLAEKVTGGELGENEARLQLARAYNDLVLSQQQYRAYNAIELDQLRPRHTTCNEVGGTVYCDTF